jgi:hypothetical protein
MKTMKLSKSLAVAALTCALSGFAFAQDDELTMTLLPEGAELPDAVTKVIELPKNDEGEYIASEEGVTNSAEGLAIANAAREDGRAFGEEMAASARENRENFSRGGRPDLADVLPGQVPGSIPDAPAIPQIPVPTGQP